MTPFRFLVLFTICIFWGLHFSVIKASIHSVPPFFYVSVRMALVALLLSPFLKWHKGQMHRVAIAGLGFGAMNYVFMFSGVKLTTASLAAVMIETYVPIATILSVIFLNEKIGWRRISGLIMAFAGTVIIVMAGEEATGADNLILGALLIMCGATSESIAAITIKRIKDISPLQMLAWFGVVGSLTTGTMSLLFEDHQVAFFETDQRWVVLGALCYSVLLASIFGHASYYWLLQRVDVSQVAGAGLMTTLFAVCFGVLLMGDPLTPQFVVGGLVTMAGVGIILLRSNAEVQRQARIAAGTSDLGEVKN